MRTVFLYLICLFVTTPVAMAQGFQFSQTALNRDLQNAASPGLMESNAQLTLAYRAAWNKTNPFRNMILTYGHKVGAFTIGTRLIQNDAGSASLKSTEVLLALTYRRQLTKSGDFIVFGVNAGALQQRFQEALFKFDSQYTEGLGFDGTSNNGESFANENQMLPILNIGISGKKYFNRFSAEFGIALNNVNKAPTGFYKNQEDHYEMGTTAFALISIPWSDQLRGAVYLAYNNHQWYEEEMAGLKLEFRLSDTNWLNLGLTSRLGEAFIIEPGIRLNKSTFTLSYDLNHSAVSQLEGFKSVFELSARHDF